jgi:acetoacetyl-CoA synthetase
MISQLCQIFANVLQTPDVQEGDDFFDLGGDSSTAIALILEIERETGVELPNTILFDAPTPKQLAALIAARIALPSSIVELRRGDGGTPLFIVHGLGGSVMELSALAHRLDTPVPVYGIQAKGLHEHEAPLSTVEEMAACYLPLLRSMQPQGPYRLAGYSMGGLIALEMAQRLQNAGETIDLLVMLDTAQPRRPTVSQWARMWWLRTAYHLHRLRQMPAAEAWPYLTRRGRGLAADLRFILHARPHGIEPTDPMLPAPVYRVIEAGRQAAGRYRPTKFRGTITFITADSSRHLPANPEVVWGDCAERFILHRVAGDHRSMLLGDVAPLAACLSDILRAIGSCQVSLPPPASPPLANATEAPASGHGMSASMDVAA